MKKRCRQTLDIWKKAVLKPLSLNLEPSGSGITLLCVTRNEGWRLPCFLEHYRKLGLSRFVFIDNDSADSSRDFLAAQEDVDLYLCREQYQSLAQRGWRHQLMARYGYQRWYLNLDADEFLVYDGMEEHPLEDLTRLLEKEGNLRPRGLLVDMYGDGGLARHRQLDSCEAVREYCRYFDSDGYTELCSKHRVRCMGGIRGRMYKQMGYTEYTPELTKHVLFFLSGEDMMIGAHQMFPAWRNFLSERILGLLHYKFSRRDLLKIDDALARQVYWNNSEDYQRYARWFRENPEQGFMYEGSREYQSPDSLVAAGVIAPIDWSGATRHMLDWRDRTQWKNPLQRARIKYMFKDYLKFGWRKKDFSKEL
ncbi:glycosyltransferase family 2 protein [Desulfovibrio sp. OttesenSCG-928-A18]|nr:glycosyltransferase family 2 protein [Desulfovibrio sp. OttesenSCG-928-A18]